MYDSVLYEWLKRLNIKLEEIVMVRKGNIYEYKYDYAAEKMTAFAKNHIIVKNFSTFNMNIYRKSGNAYTDLFQIEMKKLYMDSRKTLALERLDIHLKKFYDLLGFTPNAEALAPFMDVLLKEALFVQDYEYEDYMKLFLVEVVKLNDKITCGIAMMIEGIAVYIFTNAQLGYKTIDRKFILPQEIYMSLGRLALLIHRLKWEHDQMTTENVV